MGRRHQPEEIIVKLWEAEIALSQGESVADASRASSLVIANRRWSVALQLSADLNRRAR